MKPAVIERLRRGGAWRTVHISYDGVWYPIARFRRLSDSRDFAKKKRAGRGAHQAVKITG